MERELVLKGKGTRDWTVAQQKELLETGKISGFEGQHIRNVSKYPDQAGNPGNIQFLHYLEHLYGAHQGNFRNDTDGYYDYKTGEIIPVGDGDFEIPVVTLKNRYKASGAEDGLDLGREFGYDRKEDYIESRKRHKGEKSTYNFWEGKPGFGQECDESGDQ